MASPFSFCISKAFECKPPLNQDYLASLDGPYGVGFTRKSQMLRIFVFFCLFIHSNLQFDSDRIIQPLTSFGLNGPQGGLN
jgi:hypothetical protein